MNVIKKTSIWVIIIALVMVPMQGEVRAEGSGQTGIENNVYTVYCDDRNEGETVQAYMDRMAAPFGQGTCTQVHTLRLISEDITELEYAEWGNLSAMFGNNNPTTHWWAALKKLDLSGMTKLESITEEAFWDCTKGNDTKFEILLPESVKTIGSFSFSESDFEKINGTNLKIIDGHAFKYSRINCIDLNNLTFLGELAFLGAENLDLILFGTVKPPTFGIDSLKTGNNSTLILYPSSWPASTFPGNTGFPGTATSYTLPTSKNLALGKNNFFSVDFSNNLPADAKLKWYKNGESIGQNGATLTLPNAQPKDEGTYSLEVTYRGQTLMLPEFELKEGYMVSATAGPNGKVDPATFTADKGGNATFNFIPDKNYMVDTVTVDGKVVQTGGTSYTITNITKATNLKVTFTPIVSSVKMPQKKLYLVKGKSLTMSASAYTKTGKGKITWTSSNPKVASVNSSGKIKGIKKGKATIKATAPNGKSAKLTVYVVNKSQAKKVTKVSLSKKYVKPLKKGKSRFMVAKVNPGKATGAKVTWKSSNKKIATIDKAGKLVAKKKGTVKITVKAGGKKKVYKIKIK